jgi:hypothetical protein
MLDDNASLHRLDQCGFSDPARTLLTDIRRSPPVRRVAGGGEYSWSLPQSQIREIQDGMPTEIKDGRLGWKILHPDLAFTRGEGGVESSESHEAPRREHYSA